MPLRCQRRACIAACLFAAYSWLETAAMASMAIPVTRCDDADNPGDLRSAIAQAQDGDEIDLSHLVCSTISIQLGTFEISHSIQFNGPGMDALEIDYGNFRQPVNGYLSFSNLSIGSGFWYDKNQAYGGCIYSAGQVTLTHARVRDCNVVTAAGIAEGGGIFARGGVHMKYSVIEYNRAYAFQSNPSRIAYGGIVSLGSFSASQSAILGNQADGGIVPGPYPSSPYQYYSGSYGAGLFVGTTQIVNSTVANNSSSYSGVAFKVTGATSDALIITQSTITGNTVESHVGSQIYAKIGQVQIYNSTIAHNSGGLALLAPSSVTIYSSILARNGNDLNVSGTSLPIAGRTNLIESSSANLPPDTIEGTCPWLGRLRFNGGPTPTVALESGSSGIDRGSNPKNLEYDQRGTPLSPAGSPARQSGIAVDIGAYEVQQDDIIFTSGLDGCD